MLGLSYGYHDAGLANVIGDQIVYASHSERYDRNKNSKNLAYEQLIESASYSVPDEVVFYENTTLKRARQLLYGHPVQPSPKKILDGVWHKFNQFNRSSFRFPKFSYVGHHESHAAAGFYTSPWSEAAIVVVDAIGEFDCISIWEGRGRHLKKVYSQRYPHSLGLLYSAFTQRVGLKPNEDEYILMGMAAYGNPIYCEDIYRDFFLSGFQSYKFDLSKNVHQGIGDWKPEARVEDIAASIQYMITMILINIFRIARKLTGLNNVCYQGGVALNCSANTQIAKDGAFDGYWIMPNPGDAGASLGAALAKKRDFVEWKTPSLGTDIIPSTGADVVVDHLDHNQMVGLAQGRAEFGPRAFGNRSLLADPRQPETKYFVNEYKKRQKYRPFAPMILDTHVDEYFESDGLDLRYMQYAVKCKKKDEIPSVVHADGTSRVQTVSKDDGYIYEVLKKWYELTGCPALLNTSLNLKGMPLVNDRRDAIFFEDTTDLVVL